MARLRLLAAAVLAAAIGTAAASAAAPGYTLFGGATASGDNVELVSNATTPFSGIDFDVEAGLTVSGLTELSADLVSVQCGGGSPRFQINVDGKNIFVYLGTPPSFTSCSTGSTGDLTASGDLRVDLTQFGGAFYSTWADAVALLGSHAVTGIQLVADSGWAIPGGQKVVVDSVTINGTTYDFSAAPTSADACKNGGWQDFAELGFKNQGDCVSYAITGGRNQPAGS